MRFVCNVSHMANLTPTTWQQRAAELGITTRTIALATGVAARTVKAYRQGTRHPKPEFLEQVETLLATVEATVRPQDAA